MANLEGLVEAISAAIGAAAIVGTGMRKYWRGREIRQQVAFRTAVQEIVDTKAAELIKRQTAFEIRQGRHLDRQDRAIADLRRTIEKQRGHRSD